MPSGSPPPPFPNRLSDFKRLKVLNANKVATLKQRAAFYKECYDTLGAALKVREGLRAVSR